MTFEQVMANYRQELEDYVSGYRPELEPYVEVIQERIKALENFIAGKGVPADEFLSHLVDNS